MFMNEVLPKELVMLGNCNVQLWLTGSRHFGGFGNTSDWDFFCQDSADNVEAISSLLKWTAEDSENPDGVTYNDGNTVLVLRHFGSATIHVQFVKNLDVKLRAQELLTGFPFFALSKHERKHVWKWAMTKAGIEILNTPLKTVVK